MTLNHLKMLFLKILMKTLTTMMKMITSLFPVLRLPHLSMMLISYQWRVLLPYLRVLLPCLCSVLLPYL
jgi:hypothetical protein